MALTAHMISERLAELPSRWAAGRYGRPMLRALVVSNMLAQPGHPERGSFVRDQVRALQQLDDLEVELLEFRSGKSALLRAAVDLRRRYARRRFDVVHAHFGLSAWPALTVRARARALTIHGSDAEHPLTREATRLVLPFMDLVGAASPALLEKLPSRRARLRGEPLPCGVDLERFRELSRKSARARLGLRAQGPYLLFAADPSRREKRYDRALAVAGEAELLTLGGVDPSEVSLWVNAANAVLVPSEREGFGLAVLEALACNVPVLATPVGIHAAVLSGLPGTLCGPFEPQRWREAVAVHLATPDPRVAGRERAKPYGSVRMAERVADAWRMTLAEAE
jgi:teichuronic acid biosynthesis glycosyltransferase TuaC